MSNPGRTELNGQAIGPGIDVNVTEGAKPGHFKGDYKAVAGEKSLTGTVSQNSVSSAVKDASIGALKECHTLQMQVAGFNP